MRLLDCAAAVSPVGTVGGAESVIGVSCDNSTGRIVFVQAW
jgi:hypothetical protein